MSDRAWTCVTYVALIFGLLGIIAMLGAPWFKYDPSTKQQVVQFVGTVATSAATYVFGLSQGRRARTEPSEGREDAAE